MDEEIETGVTYGDPDVIRGLRTALDEIIQIEKDQSSAMEGMREVGKTLFTSSSLILSAVGLINFPKIIASGPELWHKIGFGLIALLYVAFAILTWRSIKPVGWTTACKEDYESLTKSLCKEEALMVAQLLTGHLYSFHENRKMLENRKTDLERAGIAMIAIIVSLLLLVAFS